MVILLKTLCFILWMLIMLALIAGSRRTTASAYRNYWKDEEQSKMAIKRALVKK